MKREKTENRTQNRTEHENFEFSQNRTEQEHQKIFLAEHRTEQNTKCCVFFHPCSMSQSEVGIILEISLRLNYFSFCFLKPFYRIILHLYRTSFEKSDDHMNEYEKLISLFFRKTLTLTADNVSPLFCAGRIDYSMCNRGLYRRFRWWSSTFHKIIIIKMFLAFKCLFN